MTAVVVVVVAVGMAARCGGITVVTMSSPPAGTIRFAWPPEEHASRPEACGVVGRRGQWGITGSANGRRWQSLISRCWPVFSAAVAERGISVRGDWSHAAAATRRRSMTLRRRAVALDAAPARR